MLVTLTVASFVYTVPFCAVQLESVTTAWSAMIHLVFLNIRDEKLVLMLCAYIH